MQPWVKWCFKHRLSVLVYAVLLLFFPVFWAYYLPEAARDWAEELRNLRKLSRQEQQKKGGA